jgi:hypothetical protein
MYLSHENKASGHSPTALQPLRLSQGSFLFHNFPPQLNNDLTLSSLLRLLDVLKVFLNLVFWFVLIKQAKNRRGLLVRMSACGIMGRKHF